MARLRNIEELVSWNNNGELKATWKWHRRHRWTWSDILYLETWQKTNGLSSQRFGLFYQQHFGVWKSGTPKSRGVTLFCSASLGLKGTSVSLLPRRPVQSGHGVAGMETELRNGILIRNAPHVVGLMEWNIYVIYVIERERERALSTRCLNILKLIWIYPLVN